jgi:hypothetical protein
VASSLKNHPLHPRPRPKKELMSDEQIEAKIEEFFHRNYEMLRAEGGRPLTGHMRQRALNQGGVSKVRMAT